MKKIAFENLPSTNTPINSTNLNQVQDNVEEVFNGEESMGSIVVEDVTCKNIFDKNNFNKLNAYIASATGLITADESNRLLYVKCEPNTTYTIQKLSSSVFAIAYTNEVPAEGVASYGFKNGGASTEVTITTGSEAKYIVFRYYHTINDKTYTEQQILDSIQIEKGSVATDYVPHKEFSNKQIYSTSEQRIGTWIDGKPLYRKVIKSTIPTTSTDGTLGDSYVTIASNIETIFVEYGFIPLSSGVTNILPFTNSNNYRTTVSISNSKTLRIMNWIASNSGEQIIVSVMYTKTTD